ncbi:MAG: phospho-N-acetylmuramoyl-pentapeptide-transferase [Spirulina sp. SIO3F2]|nr:phospho-N-acetylmuramoyl-pentapeptide-transferase [Spirulina sp. SIO3F2]
MEANFSPASLLRNPSGKALLVLLTILLGGLGISFDQGLSQGTALLDAAIPITVILVVGALVTVGCGYGVIPVLRRLKAGQVIQEDGPQSHLKKAGTPTMGGIFFVPVAVLLAWLWTGFSPEAIAVGLLTLFYGFIGWIDDWEILRRKSNKGLTPRMKMIWQTVGAVVFCAWLLWSQPTGITTVALPFGLSLPLGLAFWPLAIFVFTAESNATNITDGVDGLAGGTGAIALMGLALLVAPTHPALAVFAVCLSAGCLGFVFHNHNPAKVFMGDTGSLALGGALAAVGLLSQNLWALFILSGLFFVESLSVIAQVSYYKATKGPDGKGKRLFRMAPYHHHLELSGWTETQIVGIFYIVSFGLVVVTLLTLL